MRSINKKIAFITGASSGFGKAIAEKFAAGGFDLILNARRAEKLIDLQQQLTSQYGTEILIGSTDGVLVDEIGTHEI